MKCVLDTTVNMKQLVTTNGAKLQVPINGKSLLERHFMAMEHAGVDSVFVLIEEESKHRGAISREALKFGYSPTFVEVSPQLIAQRQSIQAAATYLKEQFIYWPVNRLICGEILKSMLDHPISNHEILSLAYIGKSHPQLNKQSLLKVKLKSGQTDQSGLPILENGYDLGIYKCSLILFKLVEKIAHNKVFSWSRLHQVLGRAGRDSILPVKSEDWGIIEHQEDIKSIEKFRTEVNLHRLGLLGLDGKWLPNFYNHVISKFIPMGQLKNLGLTALLLVTVMSVTTLLMNHWLTNLVAGVLISFVALMFPLCCFLADKNKHKALLEQHALTGFRLLIIGLFSLSIWNAYGAGVWIILSALLMGGEVFSALRPAEHYDEHLAGITDSYSIHAMISLVACLVFIPTLSLLVVGLFSFMVTTSKIQVWYKERGYKEQEHSNHNV